MVWLMTDRVDFGGEVFNHVARTMQSQDPDRTACSQSVRGNSAEPTVVKDHHGAKAIWELGLHPNGYIDTDICNLSEARFHNQEQYRDTV